MRIISFDPAGKKFGVAGIEFTALDSLQKVELNFKYLIEAPEAFSMSQKNTFMAHMAATIVSLAQPDVVVSEKPWGMGFSKDSLLQLIGALKAELWKDINWQGVSEARRTVMGDSWGGSNKKATSDWLLEYPWDLSSKRFIKSLIDTANPENDDGYDILDAILHGLCYLVAHHGLIAVVKPKKERKKKAAIKKID